MRHILIAALLVVLATPASAHGRHHARHHAHRSHHHYVVVAHNFAEGLGAGLLHMLNSAHAGPRPAAWCGWAMRQLVSSDPGSSYNLARNWARWGHPGPVGIGAVVVWPHHVGKIVGQQNGQWVVESGNDGHALRSRARSIAGAIAIRWE